MRDRQRTPQLEWPGGIVPEWAKAPANPNKRHRHGKRKGPGGGGGGGGGGKRERLQKVMAQSGHGSRRNIEVLISQGHITINGNVAKLGDLVGPGDKVKLDNDTLTLRFGETLPQVLLYHKPEGEIVTRDDPQGRATVFERLPKVHGGRWVSVGRLDLNTGGLLLFTTSGELANRLMHPRFEVEREYAVRLLGALTEEQKVKLLEGVEIEGEKCKFDSIDERGGEGANHWYHVVLREGKNREVRKLMETVGLVVSRLMRVRYGPVPMPGFLKRGMMREMEVADVGKLLEFAGIKPAEIAQAKPRHERGPGKGRQGQAHPQAAPGAEGQVAPAAESGAQPGGARGPRQGGPRQGAPGPQGQPGQGKGKRQRQRRGGQPNGGGQYPPREQLAPHANQPAHLGFAQPGGKRGRGAARTRPHRGDEQPRWVEPKPKHRGDEQPRWVEPKPKHRGDEQPRWVEPKLRHRGDEQPKFVDPQEKLKLRGDEQPRYVEPQEKVRGDEQPLTNENRRPR